MRLDHVSYASPIEHLAETVQRLGATLGAAFVDGGRHPSFGTANFLLPLSGGTYIEVVGALDHPAAQSAPFGRAVAARAAAGGGWMSWVVAVPDMGTAEKRLGRSAAAGHRVRPDGYDLRWQQLGVLDTIEDPELPFFVCWQCDPAHHPSAGAAPIAIAGMEIVGDQQRVCQWLGEPAAHPLDDVDVTWLAPDPDAGREGVGLLAVEFETPRGRIRID
jgi:hypothetical protein